LTGTITSGTSSVTFNGLTYSKAETGVSITATDTTLTAGTSAIFTVNDPVPTITTLSPPSANAGAGAQTLTINGTNFVAASTATYNGVAHTVTFVSAAQVTILLTAGDQATAGNFPVVVTNPTPGGGASNSVSFIVVGAAAKLVFGTQPVTTAAGAVIPSVTVQVEDAAGNVVTTSTASVTMAIGTNPGSGTLGGTTTVNAVSGVATFSTLTINKTGTGYTLAASSSPLTGATSGTFNITPGTATQLIFTTQPGGGTGGTAFAQQPVITIEDASGNTTTSTASVTLAIGTNPGGGTLACTTNPLAATAGVATFAGCNITKSGIGYTLTAAASGLTGATSSAFNITAGPATKLAFGTQPVTTAAGATIPAVTVQVQDAGGNVVTTSSASIAMAIGTNPNGGTLSGTTPVAAASGVATFSDLSINKTGTTYTLSATSSGLTTAISATFTITAGTATQLVVTTEPSTTAASGAAFATQPKVTVEDANGNTVTTSSVSITLAITSGTGTAGAALACTTNPVAAASGVATFAGCNINLVGSGYTLTATSGALTAGLSTAIAITPGTATKLIFTTQPSSTATGGTAFAQQPVVTVEDAAGNTVTTGTNSNASIALAINTGTGTLTCTANTVAATAGVSTFANCSLNLATSYTLKATATGLTTATSTTIVVSVGPATKLAFTAQPSNTVAGGTITPSVTISVEDAGGNVVTSSTASIIMAIGNNAGGGTLSGTTTVAAVNGVATFNTLSINKTGTGYTLSATSSPLTASTSAAFNITASTATQLVFTTQPGGASTGGVAFPTQPVVTVEDALGNTVSTNTASITLAIGTNPGGGALTCTANPKAAVAGVDTFAGCKINFAGTGYTLTAAATGLTTATSSAFTVSVGPATQVSFVIDPSTTTANAAITPALPVNVEDAGGNVVTSSTASIVVAITTNPGGGTLSGTTTLNAVAGVATFSNLSINKAGTGYVLSASSTGLSGDTTNPFNIVAGSATQIAFGQQPSNAGQGVAIAPAVTIQVEDAGGNVVTTNSDSITIAIGTNPVGGVLSGTLAQSAASGVASFGNLAISKIGTGYTLTATDTTSAFSIVTSSTFNIIAPSATYIQPFNTGHGWTYTQTNCSAGAIGGSCSSSASATTNCVTSPCVDSVAQGGLLGATTQTGYFQSPTGTYTWQTLGVPAGATVTSVQGGWTDLASGCASGAAVGVQIYDSTNTVEITSPSVVANVGVSGEGGLTPHPLGSAVNVNAGFQASSTGLTLHFSLNSAAAALLATCTVYGDNFELQISYVPAAPPSGRRGQTIVGWNRTADGGLNMLSYNIEK
jgi:hypothetical protein